MKKFSSLSDLAALMPEEAKPNISDAQTATGYDGKPYKLRLTLEKRSGNKVITSIKGFQVKPVKLDELLNALKKMCGAGGKILDNELELQGDHREKARIYLTKQGFAIKD